MKIDQEILTSAKDAIANLSHELDFLRAYAEDCAEDERYQVKMEIGILKQARRYYAEKLEG